jgi:hypothetical protein
MDVRENFTELPDFQFGNGDLPESRNEIRLEYAQVLEGPRRTYYLLLERLEQSRALLRDLSARLRAP